jgi:hypothetical protein
MTVEEGGSKAIDEAIVKVASELYADLAKPAARRTGTAIDSLFKVGLSPVAILDWGFEKSKDWLKEKIERRLSEVPQEHRCAPPNIIAVQTITMISMCSDSPAIRELYAELLLKAMDSRSEHLVHPSFIGLIGQLSPQEALVFIGLHKMSSTTLFKEENAFRSSGTTIEVQFKNYCADFGFKESKQTQLWLENLQRLKLVVLLEYSEVQYVDFDINSLSPDVKNETNRYLELTEYGRMFLEACKPENAD